ncbi:hypothetical protein, variant [Verruconis gallopava]|nr:hypothetical protein, variant [Verruconis gallopava]KIW04396.1 hypothetical protein, variant [Verruconis gallopava]
MLLSTRNNIGTLTRYQPRNAVADRSARLILQNLRTFPQKMLRSDDLPFFVHPWRHRNALPEPLAVCERICQMFWSRTPEIHGFIWRCIRAEQLRFLETHMSTGDLLAACQTQIVYVMMFVIEEDLRRREWVQELLVLSGAVCERLIALCQEDGGHFSYDEHTHPSTSWDDWVFAESRRRTACVWFMMSLVFSLQTGVRCATLEDFRLLPLPAAKLQWEASDALSWQQRLALVDFDNLITVGDLIDLRSKADEPVVAQQLDSWNAKSGQFGTLLNLAIDML